MSTELDVLPAVSGLAAALAAPRPHRKGLVGGFFEATNFPFFDTLESQGVAVRFGENDPSPDSGYPTLGYNVSDGWENVVNFDGLLSLRSTAGLSAKSRMSGPFNKNVLAMEISHQADLVSEVRHSCALVSAGGRFTRDGLNQAVTRLQSRPEVSLLVLPLKARAEKMLSEDSELLWSDLIDLDLVEYVEELASQRQLQGRLGILVESSSRLRLAQHLAERLA